MNILQVNKFYFLKGGAEQQMFDLSELLQAHGHKIIPFATVDERNVPTTYDRYFVSGVDLSEPDMFGWWQKLKYASRFFYNFEAKRKMKKLLKEEKIDLVHLHNIYHHLSPSILPVIKKQGIPVVMTIHDYKLLCPNYNFFVRGRIEEKLGRGWYWSCVKERCINNSFWHSLLGTLEMIFHHKIMKYYEKNVDLFIAPSEFVRKLFVSFGWDEKKIIVLPHFLPLSFPRFDSACAVPAVPSFAYIGRLSPEKGVKELVQYWCEKDLPYELHIYGEGPLRDELQSLLDYYPRQKIYLEGQVSRETLFRTLREKSTGVIVPSLVYETFGLVVIEAFASGVPVVANDLGSLSELIVNSNAGELFSWNDENSLIIALHKVQQEAYRVQALDYLEYNYNPENYYLKLMSVYDHQLADKK